MRPYLDIFIQENSIVDRRYLQDLKRDPRLGVGVSVVYIYALADELIPYPDGAGCTIYIGEARRPKGPTGTRFSQHISTTSNAGADSGTIYSLSRYYWLGKRIRLQIFIVDEDEERKIIERDLINAHVKEYGSLPICQGTTGKNYNTTRLFSSSVSEQISELFLPAQTNC